MATCIEEDQIQEIDISSTSSSLFSFTSTTSDRPPSTQLLPGASPDGTEQGRSKMGLFSWFSKASSPLPATPKKLIEAIKARL